MSAEIVVVGSLNLDYVVTMDRLPVKGETVMGNRYYTFPGGKGANQAVAAAKLGGSVTMIGCIGHDNAGRYLVKSLQDAGVDTRYIVEMDAKDVQTGTAFIFVDSNGDNMLVPVGGANRELNIDHIDACREVIEGANIVLVQLEIPIAVVEHVVEIAKSSRAKVILNPAPAMRLESSLLKMVDYIAPNETELAILVDGRTENNIKRVADLARQVIERGGNTVIATLGSAGAVVVTRSFEEHVPSFAVQAVDTTAAGDTFCGGLAVAMAKGRSLVDCVRFACAAGALSTTRMGAQSSIPTREEVEYLLNKGGINL